MLTFKNKSYIMILFVILLFSACSSPQVSDVKTHTNPNIYVGEFEICENHIIKLECMAGLVRFELTNRPNTIAICLSENYTLDKEFYLRYKDIIDETRYYELVQENRNNLNISK